MESLIFSLNATVPVFLMMILGIVFRQIGWIDEVFAAKMNQFVFRVSLPAVLFIDLAGVDFVEAWNPKFVLFCFAVTFLCILVSVLLSLLLKERTLRGEFIQGAYRSSAALLGIALIQSIYGTSGMAPLMSIGSVPLYNIMAVVVLAFFQPGQSGIDGVVLKKTLKGIVTNPIILGIVAGLLWSLLGIPIPKILNKTVSSIGATATPLGLMAMGATFNFRQALGKKKPVFAAAFLKLVGWCALFLPLGVALGFRQEELVAILIMLGSATTVSSFVMARNMGHEGVLSSGVVMLTTLLSGFTITGWLWILRSFGLI